MIIAITAVKGHIAERHRVGHNEVTEIKEHGKYLYIHFSDESYIVYAHKDIFSVVFGVEE